ncbi:MAG: GNAT family N-acetyltransferase [bacterium]
MRIRSVEKKDNLALEKIIKAIFHEFDLPLSGTAYEDEETSKMFESYNEKGAQYFVLVNEDDEVLGGGGIKKLNGVEGQICELQKMYFTPNVRGKGLGKKLFQHCLNEAKKLGYKSCYLESASVLNAAISMYQKYGFKNLDKPMGDTGHFSCGVWMIKEL